MNKEELKQEAEEWLNKWELCNKCENKVDCISNFSYCKKVVLQSYLAGAEPREKRIAELEAQIEKMQDKLKSDFIARLKEKMSYSTSPSCTKGMELFIKSIEKWEIKEK